MKLLLPCYCYAHALSVELDEDGYLWMLLMPAKTNFFQKLKYLFSRDDSYVAECVLNKESALQLKNYLKNLE